MTDAELAQLRANPSLFQAIVSRVVALTRDGSASRLKGCCPFHNERTPSFKVFLDAGDPHFHCYGCNKHGSVFDFVMEHERCDFSRATEIVAREAGVGTDNVKPRTNGGSHHASGHSQHSDDEFHAIIPPPRDLHPEPSAFENCTAYFEYVTAEGERSHYVRRIPKSDGGKFFLPLTYGERTRNGAMTRGWHTKAPPKPWPLYRLDRLTAADPDARVIVVEGEGCCDAAERMFPDYICTTWMYGAGSVDHTDWSPLQQFKPENIIWWADADKSTGHVEKGCFIATPAFRAKFPGACYVDTAGLCDLKDGYDAKDLEGDLGDDDPEVWLKARLGRWLPPRGIRHGNLTVFSVADLDTASPRGYLLKGIMSPGELSLWVGPPKCGKSFLMLHIAYLLSLGRPVFGRRVKRTRVLYVAAEGEAGIARRIEALRRKHGDSRDFHLIAQPTDLFHDPGHKDDLKAAAKTCEAQLIVLDTVNRVLAGGDENSSVDMGALVLYMAGLRIQTEAHVAAVHHGSQISGGTKPRGHSSLTGADDALVEVTKQEGGGHIAKVIHAKDDADGDAFSFRLDRVELGTDEDGDPITTLIVEEAGATKARRVDLTDNEKTALRVLDSAMLQHPTQVFTDDGKEHQAVHVDHWREFFYRDAKPGENQDTKKKAFQRVRDSLLRKETIKSRDEYIWRPDMG